MFDDKTKSKKDKKVEAKKKEFDPNDSSNEILLKRVQNLENRAGVRDDELKRVLGFDE